MKKIVFASLAFLVLFTSSEAAIIKPRSADPQPATSTMTFEQFKKMSPKEFAKASGKKMNFIQKAAFKAAQKKAGGSSTGKSQITAALLCWLVGIFGVHRFYLGYTWQGIVQILTLGGLGIWALIDLIRIITGSLKPKHEDYEKTF